jgi:PAS domain S-box-containing protein
MSILAVIRDRSTCHFLEDVLRGLGRSMQVHADPREAWEACQRDLPPLILVDLMLPGGKGVEFCRRLRDVPARATSLVLAITASSRLEDLQAALESGADDYVRRPLDGQLIRARLAVAEQRLRALAERRAVEEALRESELRYRTLFETSPDGIFVETLEGVILECNTAAAQMLGYSKDELLRRNVREIVPEDVARTVPEVVRRIQSEGSLSLQARSRRRNGEIFPSAVNVRMVELRGQKLVIACVRDLSKPSEAGSQQAASRGL